MEKEPMKIYVDMDGVLCNYVAMHETFYDWEVNPYPQSHPGFYKHLDPMPGAIEGINALASAGHDVFILTAPSLKNFHSWTEKAQWVYRELGEEWLERLIITHRKDLLRRSSDDYLIDDIIVGKGQEFWFNNGQQFWFSGEDANWDAVRKFFGV